MKRSVGMKWGKLQVGLLIMLAIAVLMWASFTGGGTSIFDAMGSFVCYFDDVNGLVKGSPIWMSGLEVGNVSSLGFVVIDGERKVKVHCRIKHAFLSRTPLIREVRWGPESSDHLPSSLTTVVSTLSCESFQPQRGWNEIDV